MLMACYFHMGRGFSLGGLGEVGLLGGFSTASMVKLRPAGGANFIAAKRGVFNRVTDVETSMDAL